MRHKFIYTWTNDNYLSATPDVNISYEVADCTLPELLANFENYLKACGFSFDGHLELVVEEQDNENS